MPIEVIQVVGCTLPTGEVVKDVNDIYVHNLNLPDHVRFFDSSGKELFGKEKLEALCAAGG